jgi:hypothetical protein
LGKGTIGRLSLSLDRGHEGHIREVLQEDGCLSMYKFLTVCFCPYDRNCHEFLQYVTCMFHDYPLSTGRFTILIDVYFLQFKNKP